MSNIKTRHILIFFLILANTLVAQKEASNWYFGGTPKLFDLKEVDPPCAGIRFEGNQIISLTDGVLGTNEGVSTISDKEGNLLFYTDGSIVFNALHDTMQNGDNLFGHYSSTQSAIIVPLPDNDSIFYLFTVDAGAYVNPPNVGMHYSIININADTNRGAVIQKNIPLIPNASEKITGILHCNQKDIWVIAHKWESDSFYAYLVTNSGITDTVISKIGLVHSDLGSPANGSKASLGYLKASTDGSKLACAIYLPAQTVQLFDFDNSTGLLSNVIDLIDADPLSSFFPYGLSFSPDNCKLYVSTIREDFFATTGIYQYDLTAGSQEAINNSRVTIKRYAGPPIYPPYIFGALQLGLDHKLYVSQKGDTSIGVINFPSKTGTACNLVENAINLNGRYCSYGFPTFIESYFYEPPQIIAEDTICLEDTAQFQLTCYTNNNISFSWNFGDGSPLISNSNPSHLYTSGGTYLVSLYMVNQCRLDTVYKVVYVDGFSHPPLNLGNDTNLCEGQSIVLSSTIANNASLLWSTGDTTQSITVETKGNYTLSATNGYCHIMDSIQIDVSEIPFFNFKIDSPYCIGEALIIEPDINDDHLKYLWQDGSMTSSISIGSDKEVVLKITTENNCSYSDSLPIKFIDCSNYINIPNTFSPNGDGQNDIFNIIFMGLGYQNYTLNIYDKWGNKIFETNDINKGWDGKYNNINQENGTYIYQANIIIDNTTRTRQGKIILLR